MIVEVTNCALFPPVIIAGKRQSTGEPVEFQFSDDWNGLSKYITFYTPRGQAIEVPYLGGEISIPAEIMQYGGVTRYNVNGVAVDSTTGAVESRLKVTGSVSVMYNIGENPRLYGKLTPSTLELFLVQAQQYIETALQNAKDSGEFKGDTGDPAGFAVPIVTSVVTLESGEKAVVSVTATGPDTNKQFAFEFQIPRGEDGDSGVWVSDTLETPPERDQNLWVVLEGGDSVVCIPDGIIQGEDRKVYLMCEGEPIGSGIAIDGQNFTILGNYATLAALQAAHPTPEPGDAYGIGSSAPYDVYVFDGVSETWKNYGPLSIAVDVDISDTSTNPVQNKAIAEALAELEGSIPTVPTSLKNPNALTLFGESYDGSAEVTVTADNEMSDTSTKPAQNRIIKAYIDGLIGDVAAAMEEINEIIGEQEENT